MFFNTKENEKEKEEGGENSEEALRSWNVLPLAGFIAINQP